MTPRLISLLEESRQLGFLGPGPVEQHLDHAAAYLAAVPDPPARALDLGAGGGLPGLVLAVTAWPSTRWTLVDAQLRRTDFLRHAVDELDLADRVSVVTERAEEVGRHLGRRGQYQLVVARSFGPPAVTAECAAPLLATGGLLVASEPPTAGQECDPDGQGSARWPTDGLARLGLGPAEILVSGTPSFPVHLVRIALVGEVDHRYPRRVGVPAKRPLF